MKELLSAYVDGMLSPEEKSGVEKHLQGCAECSSALSDLRNAVRNLRSLDDVEPPPELAKKVMDKIREERRPAGSLFGIFRYPPRLGIPMQLAASAIIVVTAAYMYSTLLPQHPAEAPGEYAAVKTQMPAKEDIQTAREKAQEESARMKTARTYDSMGAEKQSKPSESIPSKKMAVPSRQTAAGRAQGYRDVTPADQSPRVPQVPQVPMMAEAPPAAAKAPMAPMAAEEAVPRPYEAPPAEVSLGSLKVEEKAGGEKRADTLARSEESKTLREEAEGMHFMVYAKDVQSAAAKAGQVLREIGGVTIMSSSLKDKEVITADVPREDVSELQKALKSIGEIKEIKGGPKSEDERVRIVIEIHPIP